MNRLLTRSTLAVALAVLTLPSALADDAAPTETAAAKAPDGMVEVPAGTFWMGCHPELGIGCNDDESPYREVYLDAFYIDVHEVTVSDYKACVDADGCSTPDGVHKALEANNWGARKRSDHPINAVTWAQADAYCAWADKRLPTEAEWEKAARGTDGRRFPWGNESATCAHAVMMSLEKSDAGTQWGCGAGTTLPVGSRPEGVSPYGVHDMAGNVYEWVSDWYDAGAYSSGPDRNPRGPDSGSKRVHRGGGLSGYPGSLRIAYRGYEEPSLSASGLGFRCARSVP